MAFNYDLEIVGLIYNWIFEIVREKSSSFKHIYEHFKKIKLNYIELFNEMVSGLLFTFVPFNVIISLILLLLSLH